MTWMRTPSTSLDMLYHQIDGKSQKMEECGRGFTTIPVASSMCQNWLLMSLCTSSSPSVPQTSAEAAQTQNTSASEMNGDFQMQIERCTTCGLGLQPSSSTQSSSPTMMKATALEHQFEKINVLTMDISLKPNKNHLELAALQKIKEIVDKLLIMEDEFADLTHFQKKINKLNLEILALP